MTNRTEHTIESDIMVDIPEHQVLFSFNSDCGAVTFREWWELRGKVLYQAWVESGEDVPECD